MKNSPRNKGAEADLRWAVQSGPADIPHIMNLDRVDRPIDFEEKNQKVLCEQSYLKKFEALLNACSIFVRPTEEFISRGTRRFFYIEVMNESYLTQSQADALILGFLAADEENKREQGAIAEVL